MSNSVEKYNVALVLWIINNQYFSKLMYVYQLNQNNNYF